MINTEKTFILGDNEVLNKLGENCIALPDFTNDVEIHNWIIQLFENNEIGKLVIELGAKPNSALQIGYHVRLSIEELREKTLVPILYISTFSLNSILTKSGAFSQILATHGVYFSTLEDIDTLKIELGEITGLSPKNYLTGFHKIIHILPDETIGRHSLANIWGAFVMDRAANADALSNKAKFKKELYFKYLSAISVTNKLTPSPLKVVGNIHIGKTKMIDATAKKYGKSKRVLLIDDEADKGWKTVLRKIFKTSSPDDFVVINEKVKDFDSFSQKSKDIIEQQSFDLYILDLRLNGLEEESILNPEEFSGMKILRKIKSINEGNQVMIFTASDKAWNLKALLDAGADGYYLKESPEVNFTKVTSEQNYDNFKENVNKCFSRSYLRDLYENWKNTRNAITNSNNYFISESNTALDIAWKQIQNNYLDFGYLILYQVIENYADKLYQTNYDHDTLEGHTTIDRMTTGGLQWMMTFTKDKKNGSYFGGSQETKDDGTYPKTLFKVSCLFKIKYSKNDNFLRWVGSANKKRNDIAHNGAKEFASKEDLIKILKVIGEIRSR